MMQYIYILKRTKSMKDIVNQSKPTNGSDGEDAPFVARPCLKVELARLYSPRLSDRAAMNKLNQWIRTCPGLHRAVYGGREGKNDVSFSLRQVRLIIEFLGEP